MSHIKIKQKKLPLNYLFVITSVRPSVRTHGMVLCGFTIILKPTLLPYETLIKGFFVISLFWAAN